MDKWKEYEILKSQIPKGLPHDEYEKQIRDILDKLGL